MNIAFIIGSLVLSTAALYKILIVLHLQHVYAAIMMQLCNTRLHSLETVFVCMHLCSTCRLP